MIRWKANVLAVGLFSNLKTEIRMLPGFRFGVPPKSARNQGLGCCKYEIAWIADGIDGAMKLCPLSIWKALDIHNGL